MSSAVRSTPRLGSSAGSWAILFLAAACAALAGCGAGDPTAPGDISASWDNLEYATADGQATVSIEGGGEIRVRDTVAGTHDGLLGPATWQALESALGEAGLAPCTPPAGTGVGAVLLVRDGETTGFQWSATGDLTPAQAEVVRLLDELRQQAAGSTLVEPVPVGRLLHGFDATGPAEEILVRDEDQMIDLLRTRLARAAVVLPEIDFEREMALAVFAGPRGNDAFDVVADDFAVRTIDGYMKVTVNRYVRAATCPAVGDGIHGAFDVVRLPRSTAQVFIDWRVVALECVEP